ncbi:MAG: B-box zinc finger protein [Thermoplasmata archaeon]|nr:MAG: B-box zinc finger protein [Thermoplasmata archaeon]
MVEENRAIGAKKGQSKVAHSKTSGNKTKPPPPGSGGRPGIKTKPGIRLKGGIPDPGMCAYHKELPAGFICNKCGKSICQSCSIRYGQVVFCPQCSPFPGGYQPYAYPYPSYYPYYPYYYPQYYRQQTNVASVGGLLVIFAGILGFLYIATIVMLPSGFGFIDPFTFGSAEALFCLSFPLISSTIAVVGGLHGYHKTNFSIAVVGGIFSLFVVGFFIGSLLGFIGLLLIGTGRYEFEDVKSQMPQQPSQPGQPGY